MSEELSDNQGAPASIAVVGLCFRKGGKVYHFLPGAFTPELGASVVVETERGVDIGEIVAVLGAAEALTERPTRQLLRPATPSDVRRKSDLARRETEARRICEQKVAERGLPIKVIDTSYTLDGRRLTFSFSSDSRVDFRELVKDLAQTLRCRIELRQVGVRDQAKLIGGLGVCGRPLCCATFLRDFTTVGIRLAKDQGLSMNPAKLSGVCDRLMCCLRYEHEQYVKMARQLPRLGQQVVVGAVSGEVVGRNLLTGALRLRTAEGQDVTISGVELGLESGEGPVGGGCCCPDAPCREREPAATVATQSPAEAAPPTGEGGDATRQGRRGASRRGPAGRPRHSGGAPTPAPDTTPRHSSRPHSETEPT